MKSSDPTDRLPIKFVDLRREAGLFAPGWARAIDRVISSARYIGGEEVQSFESEFAAFIGCRFAVGTASGSDALRLALLALGVRPGDEVVTVSFTFTATVDAVVQVGATPVFVDIDPVSFTMNPLELARVMTPRVKAIVPVHLYGHPAKMDEIADVAAQHGVPILEDAAQAHGAKFGSRRCGSLGSAACFSFYPSKNLGALGDAGMVTTDDEKIANKLRLLREYGQVAKYEHDIVGYNSRLDAIQAAILREKLMHLEKRNGARRRLADEYRHLLEPDSNLTVPSEADWGQHNYHLFVIRTRNRDAVRRALEHDLIETGIHYPTPVHLQTSYRNVRSRSRSLVESERASREVLSLPMFPELSSQEVSRVATSLRDAIQRV